MKRPIIINSELREAAIECVTRSDFSFLHEWRRELGNDTHPVRVDAVNFAALACKRYKAHAPVENYAKRTEEISDYIRDNPNSEVAVLALMKCREFSGSDVIGLAHFRRSWCNNIILDYVSAHPWIASPPVDLKDVVNGVGLGLMYFVCATAMENECEAIWGEATQNSCDFYTRVFNLDSVRDLLYIPSVKMVAFKNGQDKKWGERKH